MPRPPNLDPIRATLRQLGQQIGQELATAITESFSSAMEGQRGNVLRAIPSAPGRRGRPAATASGKAPCKVPSCHRPHAAKGLCMNHYAKAKRLKMNVDSLNDNNLNELARDLRADRGKR